MALPACVVGIGFGVRTILGAEEADFDVQSERVLTRLLELEDHDLWALVSNKATTADAELAEMVRRLQSI